MLVRQLSACIQIPPRKNVRYYLYVFCSTFRIYMSRFTFPHLQLNVKHSAERKHFIPLRDRARSYLLAEIQEKATFRNF